MDTLGIWIGLNFLETFLFYYLLFGTVIDRKTLKTKDKWILYFVLIVTSTIISVWVKRSVFLLNSCLGLFSAASFEAPFLPKLQGHFAEFLSNASSVGLRILSSSTCVGLRYGYSTNNSGFSRQPAHTFPYFSSVCVTPLGCTAVFPAVPLLCLPLDSIPGSALLLRPHSSVIL